MTQGDIVNVNDSSTSLSQFQDFSEGSPRESDEDEDEDEDEWTAPPPSTSDSTSIVVQIK